MDESKAERVPLTQKEKTIYLIVTIVVVIGLIALASTRWICATGPDEPEAVSETAITVPSESSRSDEVYVSESDAWLDAMLSDSDFLENIYIGYADEAVSNGDSSAERFMAKIDDAAVKYAMSATDTATPEEAIEAMLGKLKGDR